MPAPLEDRALAGIRLFLMDVDGVLTDGRLYYGDDGVRMKAFHVRDGLGLALLRRHGVATGVISGRDELFVRRRAEELGMAVIRLGIEDKAAAVAEELAALGLPPECVAYLGDDVNDAPALARVGVPIAVADAHPDLLPHARFATRTPGGQGAVREVADAILRARGGRA